MSLNIHDSAARPYFLWDEPLTYGELQAILADRGHPQRLRYLKRMLREARVQDVWAFVTPADVAEAWPSVRDHLGRMGPVWEFLLETWRRHGLLAA